MTAARLHSTAYGPVHARDGYAADSIARIRRDVGSIVASGELGTVLRDFVNQAPGWSIGTATLLGYVLGAGVPPAVMSLAARATARLAFAAILQQQLFTPRRTP